MLTLHCIRSVGPPWYHHLSPGSSYNPGVSWLWNLDCETASDQRFIYLLQTFLQCPERCGHLTIGKCSTIGQFAHLCTKIVLKSCLGLTEPLKSRYLFTFLFFIWTFSWHTSASYLHCLHKMLPMLWHRHHDCNYPNDVGKCIKVSINIQYMLQGLILCSVVTTQKPWKIYICSGPNFGKYLIAILIHY